MKRTMTAILFIIIIVAFAASNVLAEKGQGVKEQTDSHGHIIDVGNKTCPFLGNRVTGKDFVVYEGKRYGLCGPDCKEEFLKNPERYIKILKRREGIK